MSRFIGCETARDKLDAVWIDAMVADAMRQSRFLPAPTPGGSKVLFNTVGVFMTTTAVMPSPDAIVRAPRLPAPPPPAPVVAPEAEGNRRSSMPRSVAAA